MRIAVCISGHVRNYKPYWDIFKQKVIEANPLHTFDIFISTWSIYNWKLDETTKESNKVDVEELKQVFQPIRIHIEPPNECLSKMSSQFYKVKHVGQMLETYCIEQNVTYDKVIRARFDYEISNKIDIESFNNDIICVENEGYNNDWISDKLAICSYKNYQIYSRFFDSLDTLKQSSDIPEILLGIYLKMNNICVSKVNQINPVSWPPRF